MFNWIIICLGKTNIFLDAVLQISVDFETRRIILIRNVFPLRSGILNSSEGFSGYKVSSSWKNTSSNRIEVSLIVVITSTTFPVPVNDFRNNFWKFCRPQKMPLFFSADTRPRIFISEHWRARKFYSGDR